MNPAKLMIKLMKNFDIENWERKNVYKTPEGFLDQLQENVLQNIRSFSQDIENLERKNIYTTPVGFFEEMQQNVMQQVAPTIGRKSGRIVKMNWMYAAAASITIFFGLIYFSDIGNSSGTPINISEVPIANVENPSSNAAIQKAKPVKEVVVENPTLEQDMNTIAAEKQIVSAKPITAASQTNAGIAAQKPAMADQNTESQMDQILSGFSTSELATVGRNAEQDLYLDLYN